MLASPWPKLSVPLVPPGCHVTRGLPPTDLALGRSGTEPTLGWAWATQHAPGPPPVSARWHCHTWLRGVGVRLPSCNGAHRCPCLLPQDLMAKVRAMLAASKNMQTSAS